MDERTLGWGGGTPIVNIQHLDEISYCINCKDQMTQLQGVFAYDEIRWELGLGHYAIGPVLKDVDSFYNWAKREGFAYHKIGAMFTMCRNFE